MYVPAPSPGLCTQYSILVTLPRVNAMQWAVLAVGSVIALIGMGAIVWRELGSPVDAPPGGRGRLALEVLIPAVGLLALILWLWVG